MRILISAWAILLVIPASSVAQQNVPGRSDNFNDPFKRRESNSIIFEEP